MRATCEACHHVQPPDWKPGDLCGHCGAVVRREHRCHWCAKLTPSGKFCRHCGGGLVPDEQYGAARWLKHLGADQFAIPERLAAMDPEQVVHFTRLYQRHAAVAERHTDDVALAESFTRQRGWARAREAALLPRLPLPDDELRALTLPALRGTTEAEKLLEIRESSPFDSTRLLAALARLRLWQASADELYPAYGADLEMALQALKAADAPMRVEAALTLSHWRLVLSGGIFGESAIIDALHEADSFPVEAAVNLALIQARRKSVVQPVPVAALTSEDSDMAFAAALAGYVPDPLLAALRVPVRRFAAAHALTKMRLDFALAPLLPDFGPDLLEDLLSTLAWQAQPRPDLRRFLTDAAASELALNPAGRQKARELLALDLRPGDAVRLVREHPDSLFISKVLQSPTLSPEEAVRVCYELVALDLFDGQRLPAVGRLIEADALPVELVTDTFRTARSNSLQGLRPLMEHFLNGRNALELHAFLRRVLWDETAAPEPRNQARWLLQSWYRGDYADRPSLGFTEQAATIYFGSFEGYVKEFSHTLECLAVLITLDAESDFLRPLETAAQPADADALLTSFTALPAALVQRLRTALVALARDYDRWSHPRRWAVQTLGQLHRHHPWREGVHAELMTLRGDEELDYWVDAILAES